MTSCWHLHRATNAIALTFAIAIGTPTSARSEASPDLGQVYSMLKALQDRVAILEGENRQAKKDVADARAETRALRQKMSSAPASAMGAPVSARTPPSVPVIALARATPSSRAMDDGRWRFFVGADLLYLQPRFSSNPAYSQRTTNAAATQSNATQTSFSHRATPTAVLTAGAEGPNGFGIRGRYWGLDGSSDNFSLNVMPNTILSLVTAAPMGVGFVSNSPNGLLSNETFAIGSSLHLASADIEGTWRTTSGPWNLQLAGGLRYASIRQSYVATHSAIPVDPTRARRFETLDASQRFAGFGPTAAASAEYALGWNGLSIYGNGRGSLIFGTRNEDATAVGTVIFPDAPSINTLNAASSSTQTMVPIIEGEIGVQWSYSLAGIDAVFRAGAFGQVWFNAGNAANVDSASANPSANANLGLAGFRLSTMARF
jgi:hypothetical protein